MMAAAATQKKKIMVVWGNKKNAERLKQELEERKVCDAVDIHTTVASPKKLLEELLINKGKEGYDYRMFILDDPISDDFADNLKHNFPTAHLVLLSLNGRPQSTKDIRSNGFYRAYKGDKWDKKVYGYLARKKDSELTDFEKREKAEWLGALKTEQLCFDTNYIKKPIKSYGLAAKKVSQILVAGVYQRGVKYYLSLQEERKDKSDKAFKSIVQQQDRYQLQNSSFVNIAISADTFLWRLKEYGKDIADREHATAIVKRLRTYEADTKRELERIQKIIREWEDRFPSVVQDPSAFEVVGGEEGGKEHDEGK
jgi:hypothetical protein